MFDIANKDIIVLIWIFIFDFEHLYIYMKNETLQKGSCSTCSYYVMTNYQQPTSTCRFRADR